MRCKTHAPSRKGIGEADQVGRFIGDMPQEAPYSVDAPGAITSEQAIVDFTQYRCELGKNGVALISQIYKNSAGIARIWPLVQNTLANQLPNFCSYVARYDMQLSR